MSLSASNPAIPLRAVVSVNEFCEAFEIGRTLFYRMVTEGQIRVIKIGRRTLVPIAEVDACIDRLSRPVLSGTPDAAA